MSEFTFTLPPETLEAIAQRVADILEERQSQTSPGIVTRWLTVDQAAQYIGANRQRVYDLRSSGRLSRHGDGGRALVDRHELDELVEGETG
ncbi:MAG: Helix-turn-helix domain [Gaiellales bacterium]|jgi:excisionase family DNA binding protein|nr:Helix-turn-helix domain [Gaiellales bacterium]